MTILIQLPLDKATNMVPISDIRSRILRLTVITGTLSSLFLRTVPAQKSEVGHFVADTDMTTCISQLLTAILELSSSLDINLHTACFEKIEKDCQKYPVDSLVVLIWIS